MSPWLHSEGVRLGRLTPLPFTGPLQGLDGPGLIEVEHRLELVGQPCVKVVARPPGLGAVDYPGPPPPAPAPPRPRPSRDRPPPPQKRRRRRVREPPPPANRARRPPPP